MTIQMKATEQCFLLQYLKTDEHESRYKVSRNGPEESFFFLSSFLNVQRVNFEPIRGRTDVIHLTKAGVAITTLNDSQVV